MARDLTINAKIIIDVEERVSHNSVERAVEEFVERMHLTHGLSIDVDAIEVSHGANPWEAEPGWRVRFTLGGEPSSLETVERVDEADRTLWIRGHRYSIPLDIPKLEHFRRVYRRGA